MSARYLFGPVTDQFIEQQLGDLRRSGECLTFGSGKTADVKLHPKASWKELSATYPATQSLDFIAVWLPHTSIPNWLWTAPIPVVGLACNWNLLWHRYQFCLPRCDLALADAVGADVINRSGLTTARQAVLYGPGQADLNEQFEPEQRDIDILFVGSMNASAQGERLPWLARLTHFAERYHILIREGLCEDDYRTLLRRTRIAFNRSVQGECNQRVGEALSAGTLLFQEAVNREVPPLLAPGRDYVEYDALDLETKLEHFLTHEAERAALAESGHARAPSLSFAAHWQKALATIAADLPNLWERAAVRSRNATAPGWPERGWQWSTSLARDADPTLVAELDAATQGGSLSIEGMCTWAALAPGPAIAIERFRAVLNQRPDNILAKLSLVEALRALGQTDEAVTAARNSLQLLNRSVASHPPWHDGPMYPQGLSRLRAEWERAGWAHAGDRLGEFQAKCQLLRWRLHGLLADLTGDLVHFHESALARPDLPESRAALGCALARAGRVPEAIPYMTAAVAAQPFDLSAARALGRALSDSGDQSAHTDFVVQRQLLAKASPLAVPTEKWFAPSTSVRKDFAGPIGIVWEGDFRGVHSLALVNREICSVLASRETLALSLWPTALAGPNVPRLPTRLELSRAVHRHLPQVDVHIRHQWPPRWQRPSQGQWVLIQPWEYGSLPKEWVEPLRRDVDEVWVHSNHVRECFLEAGIPAGRVHLIPLGVDSARFRPNVSPLQLPGVGTTRFLFVGGTIWRKGIDILLEAFEREFLPGEPVTLIIKSMGSDSYYRGQSADQLIAKYKQRGVSIELIDRELSDEELPRLYAACDCLVLPYRAEGFALPVAEAMACGKPVIVTDGGACRDYCDADTAILVAARRVPVARERAAALAAVGEPWVLEPDLNALRIALRSVVDNPYLAKAKGQAASLHIRQKWTWLHTVQAIENRLRVLSGSERSRQRVPPVAESARARVSLCMIVKDEEENLPDCLTGLDALFDEIIVTDTGSTDRTRDIAQSLGAKVIEFPWCDNFAAARNASIATATGDWIMWLDADDRLDQENRVKLRELFSSLGDENVGYAMKCSCDSSEPGRSATVVDHVRLFRNDLRLRWTYRVHEQILPTIRSIGGSIRFVDVTIQHVGYSDAAVRRRKLDRDLRLLNLDDAERPDDPFTLFNLGSSYHELDKPVDALPLLRRSLERSKVTDSIVRKLYALMAGCHRKLRQFQDALAVCTEGRTHYPKDAELLYIEGLLRRDLGDLDQAEARWLELLNTKDAAHFGSVDAGLNGTKVRHALAMLDLSRERYDTAETHWRIALQLDPEFLPALLGLGEMYLAAQQWSKLSDVILEIEESRVASWTVEAAILRARGHFGRKEYSRAKIILADLVSKHQTLLSPRVILSHVLLREGADWTAAEQALCDVLAIDPDHLASQNNLKALRERMKRKVVAR